MRPLCLLNFIYVLFQKNKDKPQSKTWKFQTVSIPTSSAAPQGPHLGPPVLPLLPNLHSGRLSQGGSPVPALLFNHPRSSDQNLTIPRSHTAEASPPLSPGNSMTRSCSSTSPRKQALPDLAPPPRSGRQATGLFPE